MTVSCSSDTIVVGSCELHDALDASNGGREEGELRRVGDRLAPVLEGRFAEAL